VFPRRKVSPFAHFGETMEALLTDDHPIATGSRRNVEKYFVRRPARNRPASLAFGPLSTGGFALQYRAQAQFFAGIPVPWQLIFRTEYKPLGTIQSGARGVIWLR
jgi:hypothetical protein